MKAIIRLSLITVFSQSGLVRKGDNITRQGNVQKSVMSVGCGYVINYEYSLCTRENIAMCI